MELFALITQVIGAATMILSGALSIALIIPGEQPDKALKSAVDFLTKFSRK